MIQELLDASFFNIIIRLKKYRIKMVIFTIFISAFNYHICDKSLNLKKSLK